jgi:hypothetical protein
MSVQGPKAGHPVPELASDPKRTKLLTDAMMRRFLDYLNTHRVTTYQDAFMAAHNVHRLVVVFLATRLEMSGEARRLYFSMAAQTFASALMREHTRLEEMERADLEAREARAEQEKKKQGG